MRPIELVIEGFRSYDQRTVFDWRGRQLVGIVGPIGSGKSSILDAITFALYGKTPVFERENKTLIREGNEAARVELAFEVEGQEFRVLRVLSRRGPGQHALYRVLSAGLGPVLDCERERQVGERIEQLLGLDFHAFCRSVLLAQNRFAEFLHAAPGDRDQVLKGVFGFDRLDAMHTLAKERRQAAELTVRELAGQLKTVSDDRAQLAVNQQLLALSEARVERMSGLVLELQRLKQQEQAAVGELQAAVKRQQELTALAAQLPPAEQVAQQLAQLQAASLAQDAAEATQQRAVAHTLEAEAVVAAVIRASGSGEDLVKAEQELEHLDQAQNQLLRRREIGAAAPQEVAARQADLAQAADAQRVAADCWTDATRAAAASAAELTTAQEALAALAATQGDATALAEIRQQLEHFERERVATDRLKAVLADQQGQLAQAEQDWHQGVAAHRAATAAEQQARGQAAQANERLARADEAVKLAHREDMALTLASRLELGAPCPVCEQVVAQLPPFRLSVQLVAAEAHRDQARLRQQTAAAELLVRSKEAAASQAAAGTAERAHLDARQEVADTQAQLAARETISAGLHAQLVAHLGPHEDFAAALMAIHAQHQALAAGVTTAELRAREAEAAQLEAAHAVELARQKHASAAAALTVAVEQLARAEAEETEAKASVAASADRLRELLGEGDPRTRLCAARERLTAADAELTAARAAERAQALSVEAQRHATTALRREQERLTHQLAGLAGQLGHRADELADPTLRSLDALVRERLGTAQAAAASAQAAATQAQADAVRAQQALLIDFSPNTDLEADLRAARSTADRAAAAVAELERRLGVAAALATQLENATAEQQVCHQLADDLTPSRFLRFLLDEERTRLAALGSERFEQLSGGRYRFSDDGTFEVVDLANAEVVRKAETLSGGETFLASLALAIALAEIVTGRGGRLDAFFLDEGFGSLDPEHFDLAMEGLERLVIDAPNRLVTVVSHVPEMRERLEDLIILDKDPQSGSTRVVRGQAAPSG